MSESTELMNMQYCELVEYESKHVAAHGNVSTHIQQVIEYNLTRLGELIMGCEALIPTFRVFKRV